MDKKLIQNYIYNIAYQLVKIALPLVTVPYLYAHIGAETLGISDFASNIAGWFILFGTLGVNTYGNRTIAKVRDNKEQMSITFWQIFLMQCVNMLIATVCYGVYVYFTVSNHLEIYALTGFILLASLVDITWFFYGVEDFKKASVRNILVKLAGVVLLLLFVKKPADLYLYVIINSVSELVGQSIMFLQLKKYIDVKKVSLKDAYQNHFKPTIALFVPTIAISIYTLLDQTMLGYLHSELHLNYYKTSMAFIKMFLYFITSIGAVMLPRVTNVFYNQADGKSQAQSLVQTTMKIAVMMAAPMCFGMVAVAPKFIPWYLPSAPIIANLIMIGCPIVLFISMSNVTGIQYMVPTGMVKQYSNSVIGGAVINFILNSFLIPGYGAYGAIISSCIAEASVTLIQLYFIRKELGTRFFNRSYLKIVLSAVLMYGVVYLIGTCFEASLLCNLVQAVAGVVVYFVILLVLKEELLMRIVRKVLKRG